MKKKHDKFLFNCSSLKLSADRITEGDLVRPAKATNKTKSTTVLNGKRQCPPPPPISQTFALTTSVHLCNENSFSAMRQDKGIKGTRLDRK